MATEKILNGGDLVVCDTCSDDYTRSAKCGGFILAGHACCPECAKGDERPGDKEQCPAGTSCAKGDERPGDKEQCPAGTSFADFVRGWRLRETGSSDCVSRFTGYDNPDEFIRACRAAGLP